MVRAGEQWSLLDYIGLKRSKEIDVRNGVGPFRLDENALVIPRHLGCANYDSCLSFAAKWRWPSFSCGGCRKTEFGKFVEDRICVTS